MQPLIKLPLPPFLIRRPSELCLGEIAESYLLCSETGDITLTELLYGWISLPAIHLRQVWRVFRTAV